MIGMPKPKPTSIIRHEIVLGRTERAMLDPIIASLSFKNIADPIVEIMKDTTALIAFVFFFEKLTGIDIVLPGEPTVEQIFGAIDQGIENFREQKKTEGVGEAEGFISSINYLVGFLRGEHGLV
tara:strand:- start:155 stop:526 length:372 start_codon:yes stop_codon:yes gene_type:complete